MKVNTMIYLIADFQYNAISGASIDYIDLYLNLKQYLPVNLTILVNYDKIITVKKLIELYFTKTLASQLVKTLRVKFDKQVAQTDIIICKYGTLLDKYIDIELYNNIFLIVDLRLACHAINNMHEDILYHPHIKRIICTDFLYKIYKNTSILFNYYHKFSQTRLDNIRISNKKNTFSDWNNYSQHKSNLNFNIHEYEALNWYRHKIQNNTYNFDYCMEMKGKLIFEFLYFGKQVHYSSVNKQFNDGLTDYLSLFGIDDNIVQDLHISKQAIFDKLVKFDENDKLLQFIKTY